MSALLLELVFFLIETSFLSCLSEKLQLLLLFGGHVEQHSISFSPVLEFSRAKHTVDIESARKTKYIFMVTPCALALTLNPSRTHYSIQIMNF